MAVHHLSLPVCLLLLSASLLSCAADDRLRPGEFLSCNQSLTSPSGIFALGFFSPGGSSSGKVYVGIWYNSIPDKAVVWVANREAPATRPSGKVAVMADGNMALLDGTGSVLWSTNLTGTHANTSAALLDSGNLVLTDGRNNILWQSFLHPTNTYLPGMPLYFNFNTCQGWKLVSWADTGDPSPGRFSFGVDMKSPQQLVLKEGSRIRLRDLPWDGVQAYKNSLRSVFIAVDELAIVTTFDTDGELSRYVLSSTGDITFLAWNSKEGNWSRLISSPSTPCEFYEPCGAFAYCELGGATTAQCRCLNGFEPRHRKSWDTGDFSGGCARRLPLAFNGKDAFLEADQMKLPDNFAIRWNISEERCKTECWGNRQCTAYSFANLSEGKSVGSRCLIWVGDLVDLVRLQNQGQSLYVRVAESEFEANAEATKLHMKRKKKLLVTSLPIAAACLFLLGICCCLSRKRLRQRLGMHKDKEELFYQMKISGTIGSQQDVSELSMLDFNNIGAATNSFSEGNKLGQGGFGAVYKGKLFEAHEVAIKRLSKGSGQGIEEFSNEVKLIAKLQHTNLVRLLGWCNHEEEKILVYEYMPNGSLDKLIFDPRRSGELDWGKRLRIIEGIANGLLYLHQYSRLRIIHRDLKTSNVLLDAAMNPKISDFGIAKIFGENQTEANTRRIVGTYGYMSPEYAMEGLFSEKSDVFSFGVMVLEIITGKRTTGFYPYKDSSNLLGYVWQLWREGRSSDTVDPAVHEPAVDAQLSKCVQIGFAVRPGGGGRSANDGFCHIPDFNMHSGNNPAT